MDNRNKNDFDELEPRITPHPIALTCMTTPSVPEVSLIFGNRSDLTQQFAKIRGTPEEKSKEYANWKKDGFPAIVDSRVFNRSEAKRTNNCQSPVPKNIVSRNSGNFYYETRDANNIDGLLANSVPIHYKQNQTIAVHKQLYITAARNNEIESTHLHNYQHPARDENSTFSFSRNESVQTPVENHSYDAIKSILKNSSSNKNSVTNGISDDTLNADCLYQRKSSSHSALCESPRLLDDSHCSRRSPIPRCQHKHESNDERDTVRDLLRLVKNQNEQIKSLQTQVERLLQTHEHSMGYHENCNSNVTRTREKSQSPVYTHKIEQITKNKMASPQKSCNTRGIIENPEISSRCQNDQLRNTIMEKKVSIGVMTSFEFTVQNNPFVPDSDHEINAALRESGKSINENGDVWRPNMHSSRKISTGPLENINEDSESHPSSIYKQSSNNTQVSSQTSAKFSSNLTGKINENQTNHGNLHGRSQMPEVSAPNSNMNDSHVMFFNEPSASPIQLENFPAHNYKQKCIPVLLDQRKNDMENLQVSNEFHETEKIVSYRVDDENRQIPRNSGRTDIEKKSFRPENPAEGSFVLSSSDLRVSEQSPPSPDPSIHVEMREYSSDDDNEKSKHSPAVGWTFYKNVVGQVNRILHTIPDSQDTRMSEKIPPVTYQNEINMNEDILDSVKIATLERLKMLGISYAEHSEFNGGIGQKKVTFDSTYHPPLDYQAAMGQTTNSVTETNTSMHMRALALKYLSDEQLADLAVHSQGHGTTVKHKFLSSIHGTNMSLATMNYLKRYCLVSGTNSINTEGAGHNVNTMRPKKVKHVVMTKELVAQSTRHQNFDNSSNEGVSDNILDITTLKQQPKLL